ncbi:hypothetical protein X798_05502, partial [Onchocerca flexuosa]
NKYVIVISARGLSLKGHNKLEVFANLTISGKGNWKSKVQTDVIRTTADCKWDQRCEFTLNDMDSVLTISVNHRTVLGTTDCIGAIELPLNSLIPKRMPTWYRLCKKGKYDENEQQTKYRGEICLKFEFSNKVCSTTCKNLSASSFSISTLHGSSKLDTLKRKMRIGKKKKDNIPDTTSLINIPQYGHRRSSLCEICPTIPKSDQILTADFNRDGLIIPPAATQDITAPYAVQSYSSKNIGVPSGIDGVLFGSRRTSVSSNRNSFNSSPIPTIGGIDGSESPGMIPRPRSATSSGFGSARSAVINGSDLVSVSHCYSREELIKNINDLRIELAHKDAKINDLQDYIGKLLARIMEKSPEMLEIEPPRSFFSR